MRAHCLEVLCIQDVCVSDTPRSLGGTLSIHLSNMTVGIKAF